MSTSRHYTDYFKTDAVRYIKEHPDMTMKQAAEHLGIPKETLYGWVKIKRRKSSGGEAALRRNCITTCSLIDESEFVDLLFLCCPVESVCLLYRQKEDFIKVPYDPKDEDYLKKIKSE